MLRVPLWAAALALAGCATYQPLPLATGRVAVPALPLPSAQRSHPPQGLDVTQIARLAIARSPKLAVQRDAVGVARAEAYAAGLLTDPQLGYEHDRPVGNPPGATDSYTASLALDLGNLVTRPARVAAAKAGARQAHLELLWGEWQTIAEARTLFARVRHLRRLGARLHDERTALAPVQVAVRRALAAGNLTYAEAAAGLDASADVATRLADTTRQLDLAERDLHTLLGLDASAPLRLVGAPFALAPDAAQVQRAIADMPQQRPDLLALAAGYHAQDEHLRAQILAQFPAITVGFVRARDNSDINSAGFTLGLALPLFDGNRGNIAVARATRQQLHDDYSARLLADRNDVERLASDLAADRARQAGLVAHAARLDHARAAARKRYAAGQLDWPTYLALRASSLTADTALLDLDAALDTTAVALAALAGPWPAAPTPQSTRSHGGAPDAAVARAAGGHQ